MATVRSVDFLPEIFQTDANKQFLAATLDQLIQEPKFDKTQGFIGRSVGPGVNPNDRYVISPNKTRADYQLEPGVISLKPDTDQIRDAITYPGINDTVEYQGGNAGRPDLLYSSEYYSWDPFVDFDPFVNFSQYFWVPAGPEVVDVAAVGIPTQANFPVTRENGVYTFGGISGENPVVELVRGGSYSFQVAQNNKETVNYRVRNSGTSAYSIDSQSNPTLTLARGNTYVFNLNLTGVFPFWIKTAPTTGRGEIYDSGVTRNGSNSGLVTFVVPQDAPDTLFYAAENQPNMQGRLNIVDSAPGTGPGFWIQSAPGISGVLPATPNVSSRDVFGVDNNGQDLGTVVFNVPYKTAQSFYYNLNSIDNVDLITDLRFDQINNIPVAEFVAQYGGIDGITNLNGRTLVFTNPIVDAAAGGWQRTTLFDPLEAVSANNGLPGSYDSILYDQATVIAPEDRYQLWQISYVNNSGTNYIFLSRIQTIEPLTKFTIRYGTEYSSTQWYKDDTGLFSRIPLLTAAQDILYYQDGTDPEIFGQIRLIDQSEADTLSVDQIIGQSSYTSPNGVIFTNGLKVRFTGSVVPAEYGSGLGSLLYSSTESGTNYITTSEINELYVGQQIVFSAPTLGGLVAGQTYYVRSFAANGLKFTVSETLGGPAVNLATGTGVGLNEAVTISNREYYVSGVGTAIELLPVTDFVVPELYATDTDSTTVNVEPDQPDYLTINRASRDLNAWSRSNRWFHIDVINAAAAYNNKPAVLDNQNRAKRPIIQFRPGIRLWNMGTQGKAPVDIIDFQATDAFSNINGSTGYTINGYTLVEGSRVIFAADTDADVRNKIFQVSFIVPDSVDPLIAQPVINLTLASDGNVLVDQSTVVLAGTTTAGKTYWFDGSEWNQAQQKTKIQQAPLYNVYDVAGISFGNNVKYPSTTFAGSKLFSYAVGDTNILDPILQFPLQYLNINNVGDIVFENNLYKDTFLYVEDNASVTLGIDQGSVQEYQTRTEYQKLIGWQTAAVTSQIYQQFKFNYSRQTLKLDVAVLPQTSISVPVIKIYAGSVFQDTSTYTYTTTANSTTITLNKVYTPDDVIEVLVLSDQTSQVAFYQVPVNLESNPLNENSEFFTLGTIRSHYQSICENLPGLTGAVNGANNLRDLGNVVPYGLNILQQSAPLTLAGYFLRSKEYNIFSSLQYNSREYLKFKAQMLDAVLNQNIGFRNTAQVLDTAIQDVTLGKLDSQPFYWSDMIPSGVTVASNTYTVGFVTGVTFDTVQVYNYTSANYLGLLVYKNDQLLTRGLEYTVATDGPRITVTTALTTGDTITINEYSSTYGSFVPNTPTKLGLYPAYDPGIVLQKTSTGIIEAIQGHDGSTTPLFGDIRDDVLLEFETRIYNNLKLDGNPVPLDMAEVMPGQFRTTGYSFEEINNILSQDFLSYCGWNKLDYKPQQYDANNSFTWNYSSAQNKLNNQNMLGAWRGIYRYTYDTQQPEYTPWEMLGLSIRPTWWNERYGPAPYTQDNLVLWDDIAAGYVADPVAPYFAEGYTRPGLLEILPTGSEGELLSPAQSIMGTFNETQFQKSWAVGDGGPVEASWWNSSSYPFAVMRVLALTRPAKFFALFADRDLYRYNEDYQQYLYNNRFRLDANGIEVYGNGVSKASYINWIVDYNRITGMDSTDNLSEDLKSLDVRLCYRMASFSDKQYIKLYTEKSSPNSTNTSLLIPDESYDILLYKNQPFDRVSYSSVTIQRTNRGGFIVNGYSTVQPYFNILESRAAGRLQTYTNGGITIRVPTFYTDTVVQVPYGFEFSSVTSVADFLLSYGQFLERQGLSFTDIANGYVLDWPRMVNEFMYWSQQGWDTDAIINLNPLASGLTVTKPQAIVDSINIQTAENSVLDQNSQEFPTRNLNIVRLENTFVMQALNTNAISFVDLSYTTFEHMIVLSNQSVFGDLIYDPVTGARQSRLNLIAVTSTEWNGSVDAPGFILNQDNVEEWTGTRTYSKGEIVKYKNVFWSALTIVQPSINFNFNEWTQSDYSQIELGLLPNLSNKADQLINSYNINSANIDSDNDLLSYGLIGFRPREYMAALNLDDVSQVNVYRQFLGSKGTTLSTELFKGANFGKEAADYDIYENWAVQRAVYGANANRSFFELRLNRALLNPNPSLVQVVVPQQTSDADQTILLSDVWRQSYKLTSPDILPTTTTLPTDIALPTAGYVNLNDADITVFDINDVESLNENIDNIEVGTTIWVAKINNHDWNIYRAQAVPGTVDHVCDNLNGTSRVIFSKQHNLSIGNKLIIKFFDIEIDGVYQVVGVPDPNTVNIVFQFAGDRTVANGQGLGFTLQSMRVAQASDIANLPYANEIRSGARVWVDNDGTGAWSVLEKQQVFEPAFKLDAVPGYSESLYGSSVSQAQNRLATLVGSPAYQLPTNVILWDSQSSYQLGKVVYVINSGRYTVYEATTVLSGATQSPDEFTIGGFYQILELGNTDWNQIANTSGVTYSVGSTFRANAIGSGTGTAVFVFADQVPPGTPVTDTDFWSVWTPNASEWEIQRGGVYVYVSPAADQYSQVSPTGTTSAVLSLEVTDAVSGEFASRGYGNAVDFGNQTWAVAGASGSLGPAVGGQEGAANNGYATVIYRDPALGQPGAIPYAQWQLLTHPSTTPTFSPGAGEFGYSVVMSQDEHWMYIGAPGLNQVHAYGRVDWQDQFVRDRSDGSTVVYSIEDQIQISAATQLRVSVAGRILTLGVDYTVDSELTTVTLTSSAEVDELVDIQRIFVQAFPAPVASSLPLGNTFFTATNIDSFSVRVGGVLYRPNIDYTFNEGTKTLTFAPDSEPAVDAEVLINAQGYFEYVDTITVAGLPVDARFGHSVSCSTDGRQVMVGTPNQTVNGKVQAGAVYVFDRNVQKFIRNNDSSNSYVVLGTLTEPVTVYVNNTQLINENNSIIGAPGTFSVSGNTVTIIDELVIGDTIEIETNQFKLIQALTQNVVAEFCNFGTAVDLCAFNCSLYVGEPQSSLQIYKGGIVERSVNQSRTYGIITSLYTYQGTQNPAADYSPSFVPGMYKDNGKVNNRTQYSFVGALTAGNTLRVNNIDVEIPASNPTLQGLADAINGLPAGIQSGVPNVLATVSESGYLTLSVKNSAAAPTGDKLQVSPGSVGTAFANLGFDTFVWTQNIVSPYPVAFAGFGSSISIDTSAVNLVVGAPRGTLYIEIVFDDGTVIFDVGSTEFFDSIVQGGAVYTFDYLSSSSLSLSNPGKFVFGAQISSNQVTPYANFGQAVNYTSGVLMVGTPTADPGDSTEVDYGSVFVYNNASRQPVWQASAVQQPVVDIRLLNSVFLYDQITSATTEFLDFMDPLQGKILGAARQNIDYIGGIDPAAYNSGPNNVRGTTWGASYVGQVWWDTSTVRFIDPNQDDIVYASRRWAQVFPGSSVDVYQWIASPVPPANYTGEGTVRNNLSYTVNSKLSADGTIVTEYFFWVRGITVTPPQKSLPVSTVASYIENPRASGIPYLAPINASTVALYNAGDFIEASDTVLHIEFDRELTADNVHVEYELIAQGRADGFLSTNLYRKLQDSFCGVDTFGNQVPDLGLSPAERYGVQFRPRQSMFVDRFEALRNYLTRANTVLKQYPITESRVFNLLNSSEPELPQTEVINGNTVTNWNFRVANLEILGFQNINAVPLGYRYLVTSDSNNRGLWTIYQVQNSQTISEQRELVLVRVQNYNTPDYWSYINWFRPGYNSSSKLVTEVSSFSLLNTLNVPAGSSVKVTANAQGKFEIYLRTDVAWERVGLQDGTIEFSAELWDYAAGRFGFDLEVFDAQYYDQEPVIETRKIIQAINEELFVDDLAIERNRSLILVFDYVLSEFSAPEWLVKTSLIDVDHRIRDLLPYQNFIRDNQEFVEDYIQEVKPYHVQIREFNLQYAGFDDFRGDLADFDLPAYFNTSLEVPQYTSPVLLPYQQSTAFNASLTTASDLPASSTLWTSWPYSEWYQNYLLNLVEVEIISGGQGYNEAPVVTFEGDAVQPAQGFAIINSLGQVTEVKITTPGIGYRSTPTIVFTGGNGTGVRAYAIMNGSAAAQDYSSTVVPTTVDYYSPVRTFRTTMKFDRYQYVPTLTEWNANATYQNGDLVRYDNRVWQADSEDSTEVVGPTFDLENWQLVNAGTYNDGLGLSGVDRTMGLYVAGVNSPGLELPLLIDGIDYPGVQVYGDYFLGDPSITDAVYQSEFTDTTLGNRFSDINVNGGQFIGPYEGHAPEELVNGSEFDTLDFKVFTRPGSDWNLDGHGFEIGTVRYVYEPAVAGEYSWANVVENPVQVLVSNLTTGRDLARDVNYTVNWVNQTVSFVSGVSDSDIVNISVYEAGGGSQLYRANYIGADVGSSVVIPVNEAEIYEVAVFVNGQLIDSVTWVPYFDAAAWSIFDAYDQATVVIDSEIYYRALQSVPVGVAINNPLYWVEFVPTLETLVNFGTTLGFNDGVALVALGVTVNEDNPTQYSWSTPQIQTVVAGAALTITKTITATNSLEGTNPANMIVTRNGLRLRPAEGIEWIGDDSSVSFGLPQRGGYEQNIIDPVTDVLVWVDGVAQTQSLGSFVGDFSVTNWDGSNTPGRQVVFATPPAAGATILISVNTVTDYVIAGNQVQIVGTVNQGDVFEITTWNDTAQQNILTQVFVGPIVSGITINEPYDSTNYDPAVINNTPGSYDFTAGTSVANNQFNLGRTNIVASRLWVTLDGVRLFEGADYTVENGFVILSSGAIGPTQVMAVTQFTNSVTPEEMGFRIFQDMRGVQAVYRITRATTTELAAAVSAAADSIRVVNAAALSEPNLELGIFGVVIIDGERIMYRARDLAANTISSLLRGTAGTAAADHAVGTSVTDLGRGNLLDMTYQDRVVSDTALSDGSTVIYYAPSITDVDFGDSSTIFVDALEVYVGGQRQYPASVTESQYPWVVTDFDPVAVEFLEALPPEGVEVTILVRRGLGWYGPGVKPTNGTALQDTDTLAARFLRGL
jgi:hypothetical protein